MFKIANFKHGMLEAVRSKSLKLMGILMKEVHANGGGSVEVDMQVGVDRESTVRSLIR